MRKQRLPAGARALGGCLALACAQVGATGLQVAPTTLALAADRSADGLWLSNSGTEPLHAQVRAYAWTQDGGEDHLAPSRELAISPPMLQLEPGARQLVRVIRLGAPPAHDEAAYRLLIDELPIDAAPAAPAPAPALRFVLRYSVPVFVAPTRATAPDLHAQVLHEDGQRLLEVRNSGSAHAQLANISIVDADGQRTEVVPGLLGYVLPGRTMRWPLALPAATLTTGGNLQTRINGEAVEHALAPVMPLR